MIGKRALMVPPSKSLTRYRSIKCTIAVRISPRKQNPIAEKLKKKLTRPENIKGDPLRLKKDGFRTESLEN